MAMLAMGPFAMVSGRPNRRSPFRRSVLMKKVIADNAAALAVQWPSILNFTGKSASARDDRIQRNREGHTAHLTLNEFMHRADTIGYFSPAFRIPSRNLAIGSGV
jgi:hypothetical protein